MYKSYQVIKNNKFTFQHWSCRKDSLLNSAGCKLVQRNLWVVPPSKAGGLWTFVQRTRILSIRVLAESSQNCNVVSCISLYWVTLPACRGRRPDWNRVMELFHEQRGVGGVMKLFGEELKKILRSLLIARYWDLSLRSSITGVTWKYYMIIDYFGQLCIPWTKGSGRSFKVVRGGTQKNIAQSDIALRPFSLFFHHSGDISPWIWLFWPTIYILSFVDHPTLT